MTERLWRPAIIAALSVVLACQQGATIRTSPPPTVTPAASPTSSLTPTATAAPPRSVPATTPEPTPVVLTVSGRVTRASDGRPVPGVRLRFAPFAINDGRPPGPDVVVTSDATGAYSAKVPAWTLEALANSSSSQLSLFVTPPAGMKVITVTQSGTLPIGPLAPNVPDWYFMLAPDLNGPIDIVLEAQ
jgi:hypothetical protein